MWTSLSPEAQSLVTFIGTKGVGTEPFDNSMETMKAVSAEERRMKEEERILSERAQ